MDRQEAALKVAEELLEDIETKRLKASDLALKANRLARLSGHEDLTEFLALERNGYPTDDPDARVWISRAGRWADEDNKFFRAPLAKIEAKLEAAQAAMQALKGGGNYSGEYSATAARNHDQAISTQSKGIGLLAGICGQVVATIYDFTVEIYHELLFSELQATLFAAVQSNVDGALAAASGSALDKIERVSDRLRDGDTESISQGLTTCRRLIDSCADHLFPDSKEPYDFGDGATLNVGKPNVLNRLQAYCHAQGVTKSRRARLRRTLSDLYERCSAGTHSEVTVQEARFVFLQTYVVLGELLTLQSAETQG